MPVSATCAGCAKAVIGECLHALGKSWHPACFKCQGCSISYVHRRTVLGVVSGNDWRRWRRHGVLRGGMRGSRYKQDPKFAEVQCGSAPKRILCSKCASAKVCHGESGGTAGGRYVAALAPEGAGACVRDTARLCVHVGVRVWSDGRGKTTSAA